MRIAIVIERFQPHGGVEGAAWQLAHGLAAAGDDVHVVARCSVASSALRPHRVAVSAAWQPTRVAAFSWAAGRAAPRGSFDIVHSFSRTRHQDVYSADGGSHAAYMEHQYPKIGRALRRLSPRHAILLAIETRIFADSSQVVLCPSRFVANEIAARHGVPRERLEVIPYGVDLERFDPSLRDLVGSRVRAELGAGAGPIWLLVGSGWRRKGLDTALRALALARSPDAVLWIAGSDAPGAWQARAAALGVAARVHFLGHRRDVEHLYAAADALVLPTRYDAFGAVCLEAAAAALPVVTSGAAGAAELLGEGALVVADADDAAGFAAALAELADPAVRRARGAAGRVQAERHDVATRVAAVRALYARILVHRRGGSA